MICSSCGRQNVAFDRQWASPTTVAESESGLDYTHLLRWQESMLFVRGDQYFLFNRQNSPNGDWRRVVLNGVPEKGYLIGLPGLDRGSNGVFYSGGIMEHDQLVMSVLLGNMNTTRVQIVTETRWTIGKPVLFGPTGPSVRLNNPGRQRWPYLGAGVMRGSDLLLPYCLSAISVTTHTEEGPFNNGIFHSVDAGKTWRMERISTNQAFHPAAVRSAGYYQYFVASLAAKRGAGFELVSSRKAVEGGTWTPAKAITSHLCIKGLDPAYSVVSDGQTTHLCWLDRRNEKRRLNPMNPQRENYEIAYSCRKDSDADWQKGVIVSKGVFYSYTPSISVESNRIVVVWSGSDNDEDLHGEHSPNDVFYATSKDGGNTWMQPVKVTNSATNGITSGRPQVMLLNGTIHLFYIQGQRQTEEISPGLTKLNQPPWPIIYQWRDFPN